MWRGPQGVEGGGLRRIVAAVAQLGELLCLAPAHLRVHAQGRDRRLLLALEFVDADDDAPLLLQLALIGLGSLLDLTLDVALLHDAHTAAARINRLAVRPAA